MLLLRNRKEWERVEVEPLTPLVLIAAREEVATSH